MDRRTEEPTGREKVARESGLSLRLNFMTLAVQNMNKK